MQSPHPHPISTADLYLTLMIIMRIRAGWITLNRAIRVMPSSGPASGNVSVKGGWHGLYACKGSVPCTNLLPYIRLPDSFFPWASAHSHRPSFLFFFHLHSEGWVPLTMSKNLLWLFVQGSRCGVNVNVQTSDRGASQILLLCHGIANWLACYTCSIRKWHQISYLVVFLHIPVCNVWSHFFTTICISTLRSILLSQISR